MQKSSSIISFTLAGAFALTACAAARTSPLAVQKVSSQIGSISGVRAHEQNGRLFVTGSARPSLASGGNHVDVQLIGADGRILAQETEPVKLGHPRGSRARHGGDSFVASFPLATARPAACVRVIFHSSAH